MSESPGTDLRVMFIVGSRSALRSIVRQQLGNVGISDILEMASAEEAFQHFTLSKKDEPDLIICDLHLEGVDGMQLVHRIRRGKGAVNKDIPILIMTGEADELLHEVVSQVGATRVITIPISGPKLIEEIETAVGFSIGQTTGGVIMSGLAKPV